MLMDDAIADACKCAGFVERFWSRVERTSTCWKWSAGRKSRGYGTVALPTSNNVPAKVAAAHRVAWIVTNGPIPNGPGSHGTCVLHRCDNPPCVNPAHLFLGTNADNNADMMRKGRYAAPKGQWHGRAKLMDDDVRTIRELYARGWTQVRLASRYGISQPAISSLLRRETWRMVD